MKSSRLTVLLALTLILATPTFAADNTIFAGLDLWRTADDGSTQADFVLDPIPADFFCSGSEPFTGKISFKGRPIASEPAGILGGMDTIVYRLDDAVFNAEDRALTRVQVIAMEFDSISPVKNDCGTFDVRTVLDGEQPITSMEIVRLRKTGGRFAAPISVRIKLIFTPRDGKGQLELKRSLDFGPAPNATWANKIGPGGVAPTGFFRVDTDADGEVDTWVPGTSNFAAGWDTDMNGNYNAVVQDCHCDFTECGHIHCIDSCPPGQRCLPSY